MNAIETYEQIGQSVPNAVSSQMFGKPCFKIEGKAFASFFQEAMVFKLTGTIREEAQQLEGALLFDPSGKGRPMKEWIQVPFAHKDKWPVLAAIAAQYVRSQKTRMQ
jgi:hypothetical protein